MNIIGVLIMTLFASTAVHANEEVLKTLQAYAQGTEQQNVELLDANFHPQFRVVAKTEDGLRVIEKAAYLGLIKDKKIGGQPRELNITSLNVENGIAQVQLVLTGESSTFHDHLELINADGHWQIVHNLTQVVSK
jgi:hypothetical protein